MSTDLTTPARVLRGAAATAVRTAFIGADLSVVRPALHSPASPGSTAEEIASFTEQAREEAARVGYEDGFAAGRREAVAQADLRNREAAAAVAAALAVMEAATAQLHQQQTVAVADVEQQIVATALQIAEAVVGRELQTAEAPARDALVRALALAPQRVSAVARLHPDDVATIDNLDVLNAERSVTLVADGAVERGGCVLDVGACRIDAQVGPALQRVREALTS
jgi:flagellar assembly protein FliH